jgi:RHS repeat-associated protein
VATGTPPFGSFSGGPDIVNNANLDVHLQIPILAKAGRGLPFSFSLSYDNSVWFPEMADGYMVWAALPRPLLNWDVGLPLLGPAGSASYTAGSALCTSNRSAQTNSNFGYTDPSGTFHSFKIVTRKGNDECPAMPNGTATAQDGSGYTMSVTNYTQITVYDPSANTIIPFSAVTGLGSVTDPNGNVVSASLSGTTATFTDSLGMTVLTISAPGGGASTTYTYTGPNGPATYTEMYSSYTVQTNFGCSGITEFGATQEYLVSEIELPDNTRYTFTYEGTPGHSGNVTGRLASVTLPTAGTISYSYSGGSNGITCADGSTATLTRSTPDGAWTYAHSESGSAWTTVVTDPAGNQTTMNFQGLYETERQVYQGSSSGGRLLRTVSSCYNGNSSSCNTTAITLPITQRTVTTTLPTTGGGTAESEVNTYYNSYGLVTKNDEYDYGNGSVGAFKRETMTCYATLSNANIVDRPSNILIYSATGNPSNCTGTSGLVAETSYGYDGNGNLTSETRTNTGGSPSSVSRTFTYGSYGVLTQSTDFKNNPTTYGNFECASNTAFPGTVTSGGLTTTLNWNCNGALVGSVEDPNSQTTTYSYDTANNFWRLAGIGYPDGGQTNISYNDSSSGFSAETSRLLSGSTCTGTNCHQVTQYLDGLGRVIKSVDSQTSGEVDTTYDSLGRVYTVSNPHTGTSAPSDGLTTYGYDALNRLTSIAYPDTAATSIGYSGNCSTTKDPAGKQRTLCTDALGRVTSVAEDPNGLDYSTAYSYDDLNDLHTVSQGSSQTRTYNYDMLGRLTSTQTPEAGTTSYTYDANGSAISRTDARNITTTYAYDALNRLTSKAYSDGTPSANFFYDQAPTSWPAWSGASFTNAKGRLVLACTNSAAGTCASPATATAYSYDPVGRTLNFWQCDPSNCTSSSIWNTQYNYDLAGDVISWVHPAGYTLTNAVNAAQQITAVQSSWQDSSHPQYLAQNVSYTAWGAVSQLQNGCVGSGCVNAQETYQYNNRLQPVMIELGTTSNATADYCLVYNYYSGVSNPTSCTTPPQGSSNNGNVMGYFYQDSVSSSLGHTASFTYDGVNRLSTAAATGNSTYNLTFSYDPYGNVTCTTNGQTQGYCPNWAFNAGTNQLTTSGFAYDAAGDLTADGTHTYQWDAEGRLASVDSGSTEGYTYNALGQQVHLNSPSQDYTWDHLYDTSGSWIGRWSGSAWAASGVFHLGARPFAIYIDQAYFIHVNALGSTAMNSNSSGSVVGDILYYPWGQGWAGSSEEWHYAGFEQGDGAVAGLYPTLFREYAASQGRWLSPDPLGGDITNPQSLNRYGYVMNNPLSNIDPTGQACYGIMRALGGGCDAFMGPSLGWDWNEFDLMNIPVWGPWTWGREGKMQGVIGTGFDFFGMLVGPSTPATLPLSGIGRLLAALVPQIQPAQQNACTQTVLGAVNSQFGTNFTDSSDTVLQGWQNGSAYNLLITGAGLPAAQFNAVRTGRYPLNWWSYLIGYGPTLHITGQTYFNPPPAEFYNVNNGGATQVTFTGHIDSAFLFNPIGALIHLFRDVLGLGGPHPCPH